MVKVVSMGLKGTVSSKPDAKGDLFVQCGIIRSKVNLRDLVLINEDALTPSLKSKYSPTKQSSGSKIGMSKTKSISMEINLLGRTVDEAIAELDKYLDDAMRAGLAEVRIIHGKGTGALRLAVQRYLKSDTRVRSYRGGLYGEGDSGVTVVELKK